MSRPLPLRAVRSAFSRLVGRPLGALYLACWALLQVVRNRAARGVSIRDSDAAR